MEIDPLLALAGLVVGFTVGLTGMGGGALTTPLLVLVFGVQPLAAVSSDLVASMVMKPVGGAVHLRHGTVHRRLAAWLMVGSIPSAFFGVVLLRLLGEGNGVQDAIKLGLGVALLLAAAGIVARVLLSLRRPPDNSCTRQVEVKRALTILIGVFGGVVVGLTSVGSGSLMIVLLLMAYPRLGMSELVGTDLVQAVPLVSAAAIGHLFFGDFRLGLTVSLLIGSIPGVYVGARLSARAPAHLLRPALVGVLVLTGAKLLGATNVELAWIFAGLALVAAAALLWGRRVVAPPPGAPDPILAIESGSWDE